MDEEDDPATSAGPGLPETELRRRLAAAAARREAVLAAGGPAPGRRGSASPGAPARPSAPVRRPDDGPGGGAASARRGSGTETGTRRDRPFPAEAARAGRDRIDDASRLRRGGGGAGAAERPESRRAAPAPRLASTRRASSWIGRLLKGATAGAAALLAAAAIAALLLPEGEGSEGAEMARLLGGHGVPETPSAEPSASTETGAERLAGVPRTGAAETLPEEGDAAAAPAAAAGTDARGAVSERDAAGGEVDGVAPQIDAAETAGAATDGRTARGDAAAERGARATLSEAGAASDRGEAPRADAPRSGVAETTGEDRVDGRAAAEDASLEAASVEAASVEAAVDGWRVRLERPSGDEAPLAVAPSRAAVTSDASTTGRRTAASQAAGPRKVEPEAKAAADELGAPAAKPPLAKIAAAPGPAAREAALELDAGARRQVQARLRALGFAPGPIDGAIGPRTRSALEAWQRARGHAATGRLHAAGLAALAAEAPEVGVPPPPRWASPPPTRTAPSAAPRDDDAGCPRDATGTVLTGRSFACDLVYLREDLIAALSDG